MSTRPPPVHLMQRANTTTTTTTEFSRRAFGQPTTIHTTHTAAAAVGAGVPDGASGETPAGRSRPPYPLALPSVLSQGFTGPVTGIAVIDGGMYPEIDSLVEMVTPDASPLLDPLTQEYIADCRMELEESGPTGTGSGRRASLRSGGAAGGSRAYSRWASTTLNGSVQCRPSGRAQRRVLCEGGYVLFSDDYIHSNPCSVLSGLTQEFQLVNPFPIERPVPDPKLDERKQRLEEVKHYIKEVQGQHRPLFRKKTSDLVYGRSTYFPCDVEEEEAEDPCVLYASAMPSPVNDEATLTSHKARRRDDSKSYGSHTVSSPENLDLERVNEGA